MVLTLDLDSIKFVNTEDSFNYNSGSINVWYTPEKPLPAPNASNSLTNKACYRKKKKSHPGTYKSNQQTKKIQP